MRRSVLLLLLLAPLLVSMLGCAQYLGYQIRRAEPGEEEPKAAPAREQIIERKYGGYDQGMDLVIEPMSWFVAPIVMIPALAHGEGRALCWWPPFDLIFRLLGDSGINHVRSSVRCYAECRPSYPRRLVQWFGWFVPGYSILAPPSGMTGLPVDDIEWQTEVVAPKPRRR